MNEQVWSVKIYVEKIEIDSDDRITSISIEDKIEVAEVSTPSHAEDVVNDLLANTEYEGTYL